MATTISTGSSTITPNLVQGFAWERVSRTVLHDLLDSVDPAVTVRAAGKRAGTLRLLFLTEAEALAADSVFAQAGVFSLASTERPALGMRFVVSETTKVELDPDTLTRWTINVPFQEVP